MQFLEDGFEGTWGVQNWVDYGSWMKHDGWFWWALYTHWKLFTWEPIQPSQDAEQRFQVNTYTHENPSWHLLGGEQNIFYDLLTEMGLPEHLHWFLQKAPRTAALDAFSWFSGARFTSMYITAKFSNIPFLKFHSCRGHLSCPCHSQQKDGLPCRHNPPEPKRDFSGIACFTWLHPESQLERKVKESNVWRFSAQIGLGKPQAVVNCAAHLFNPYLKHVQELLQTHGLHESSAIQRCSSKQPEILSTIFYLRKLHNRNAFASGPGTMWSPVGHEPLPSWSSPA